jgi:hypothetical protein
VRFGGDPAGRAGLQLTRDELWDGRKLRKRGQIFMERSNLLFMERPNLLRRLARAKVMERPKKVTAMILAKLQHPSKTPDKGPEVRGWSKPAMSFKRRASPRFKEHSLVRARCEIREGGDSIPAGATGTIVHVIGGGIGYQVEFTMPRRLVISALPSELIRA